MKPEFLKQLDAEREHVAPAWSPERAAAVRGGLRRRAASHQRRRVMVVAAATLLLVGGGAWLLRTPAPDVEVTALSGAQWHEVSGGPHERVLALDSGGAWFDVTPGRDRAVRVVARDVEVRVQGTRFLVEHVVAGVHVQVEHGSVQVRAGGSMRELHSGEGGVFGTTVALPKTAPPPAEPASPVVAPVPTRPAVPSHEVTRAAPAERAATWKQLAEQGDFNAAWVALQAERALPDDPETLLLAADVARLTHHADAALAPLRQLLVARRDDPRAPLAAFTLGRVLLDDLGRPREAVDAFATAFSLDPLAPLAEHALAREVEALDRAGERADARARAQDYVSRYPAGARLRAVRHYGGLE